MRSTCNSRLVPLGLISFLVLFNVSLAQFSFQDHQSSRVSGKSECQFQKITAREPNRRQVSEAGFTEFWDSNENDELECAGIQIVRHTIYPKGLFLPYYPNTPELVFVVQGQGIQGTVIPGCEESFETSFRAEDGSEQISKHQKVYRYKEGDVLTLPAGMVHWTYNDGDTPIIIVALRDTSNVANQLHRKFRKFFLAGNPQSQVQKGEPWGTTSQPQQPRTEEWPVLSELHRRPPSGGGWGRPPYGGRCGPYGRGCGRPPYGGGWGGGGWEGGWGGRNSKPLQTDRPSEPQQEQEGFNMYKGFTDDTLQLVYGVDNEIVSHLKGLNDDRGLIVLAPDFQVLLPEEQFSLQEWDASNYIQQPICSIQLSTSISSPASADVFNPRGGRLTSLNSNKLPILKSFQLSAERGVLYKNALLAPHFNLNAHSIMYITSGSARVQIVGNEGVSVFDDVVRAGQLIVVPQGFPIIIKAEEEGLEWVAFKTNDNAITGQLAGRFSYIRALPDEVLASAYDITKDQAKELKYNRKEGVVLSPRSGSASHMKEVKNAVLNAVFG